MRTYRILQENRVVELKQMLNWHFRSVFNCVVEAIIQSGYTVNQVNFVSNQGNFTPPLGNFDPLHCIYILTPIIAVNPCDVTGLIFFFPDRPKLL